VYPNEAPIILIAVEGDADTAGRAAAMSLLLPSVELADVWQKALVVVVLR
jgi:hypothetical protein